MNVMLSAHMEALQLQIPRMAPDEAQSINWASAALVAACFNPSIDRRGPENAALSAASLRLARRAIEQNLSDMTFGPEKLLRSLALSRTRLYKMFEPLGGVHGYIQRRRLARACAEIESNDDKVGVIAERWGFGNIATFNRLFRQAYGMAPRDARAVARMLSPANPSAPSGNSDAEFVNRWLLGLD